MSTVARSFSRSLLLLFVASKAYAGRPLSVDDAGVNDKGTGHVEAWYARQPGHAHTWTIAPAYSPVEGIEFGAALTRDRTNQMSSGQAGIKFLITPSRENGCNAGAAFGLSHTRHRAGADGANSAFIVGLATCNGAGGSAHLNLGGTRDPGVATMGTWGIAYEREVGVVTAHVEAFGQRHAKPTYQVGARFQLTEQLQIDGTIGRSNRETLFSVGFRLPF